MRKRFECQLQLGRTAIEKIQIPLKSRDELPPILAGLQWMFLTPEVNEAVFQLLEKKVQGNKQDTGRPGMDLWHILVLGVTRLGLDCDFDRLEHHANYDVLLREILGIPSLSEGGRSFHQKTLSQNVCMVDDELLTQINAIVVRFGRQEFKKKEDEKIAAKTDSYVLETNVHFPTDINLLWDAGRKCIELSSRLSDRLNIPCWRKSGDWKKRLKVQMRQVGRINHGGGKNKEGRLHQAVKSYLSTARELERKVAENLVLLAQHATTASERLELKNIGYFLEMLVKHIDLIDRRILKEEKIPHEEKVFSLFEPHTEWITKGKTWPPMELGHKLLITTDQYQLVLDYKVMDQTSDQLETSPLAKRLFESYGEEVFESMSFDKGFSNEGERKELESKVSLVVMPKKGRRRKEELERERAPKFVRTKNQHSAIESEINCLEHHGLNRCPDKGYHGYQRYVGFGILAYNLHKIGKHLIAKKRKALGKYDDPVKVAA
jgi:IS5 family transposase